MSFVGLPDYDTSNGGKKLVHRIVGDIEYKWCGGSLCLNKAGEGMWKELSEFNKCISRWDKLETICKKCKAYNRSSKRLKEKKIEKELLEEEQRKNKGLRKCNECLKYKTPNSFSKCNRVLDGLMTVCRICRSKNGEESNMVGKPARAEHTIVDGKEGKICTGVCGKWKSFEDNNYKEIGLYGDGTKCYSCYCRECTNKKEKERYAKKGGNRLPEDELLKRKIQKSENTRVITILDGIEGKVCSNKYHSKWLPLTSFVKYSTRKYIDGKHKYSSHCCECLKFNKSIKLKRRALIKELEFNLKEEEFLKNYVRPKQKNGDKCIEHDKYYRLCYECYPYEYKKYYKNMKLKRMNNLNYRLKELCRGRIRTALKNNTKTDSTEKLVGCTIEELWEHLEYNFKPGMTRENHGSVWQIDHYIPISAFDLTKPFEQLRSFNWRNLQPLFVSENLSKGAKYEWDVVWEMELYWAVKETLAKI